MPPLGGRARRFRQTHGYTFGSPSLDPEINPRDGAAPALEDPSDPSLLVEGPDKGELEMGALFAISAVSMTRICVHRS